MNEGERGGEEMVYLISYDLNKTGKNYEGVYQAIKDASTGVWCHPLESTWLIKSTLSSANSVFEKIKPELDSDDRCFVIEVSNNYQGWLTKKMWDYINENLFN